MHRNRKILIFSLSLNVIILIAWIGKRIYYNQPTNLKDTSKADTYDSARMMLFNNLPIDSGDIVFVGNSITEAFPVTEIYGSRFKNRGIGSNLIYHVQNRIPGILKCKPKAVFLLIGINDIKAGFDLATSFESYKTIIDTVINSGVLLYVSPVLPVSGEWSVFNDSIKVFNAMLVNLCEVKSVPVFDLYTPMVKDGLLNNDYTYDGLHMNGAGYTIWKRVIDSIIKTP